MGGKDGSDPSDPIHPGWGLQGAFAGMRNVLDGDPVPGSSVHGIFQARVLEWIAISFSRGPSGPRNQTRVSCIVGRPFTV